MRGVALADIMNGYSIYRNPKLAGVFYCLQLIDAVWNGDIENLCGL